MILCYGILALSLLGVLEQVFTEALKDTLLLVELLCSRCYRCFLDLFAVCS